VRRWVPCSLLCSLIDALAKLRKATISFVTSAGLSVRPHVTTQFSLDGSSWNLTFDYVSKIQVSLKSDKNNDYIIWRPITFFIISRSSLLRMRSSSDKSCRKSKNTHFVFNNFFFENRAVYGEVQPGRPQIIIWGMRIACWISKATNTLRICNTAFPLQHWLHESASMLRYMYTVLFFHVAVLYRLYLWPIRAVGICRMDQCPWAP
jgi:hypothetical protein